MFPSDLEVQILEWFMNYAYEPYMVYAGIFLIMYASSFGLPLPEEIIIISAGIVAHIAAHPQIYPPPEAGAQGVNLYFTAALCFVAVFTSDLLIYTLGWVFGGKLLRTSWFTKMIGPDLLNKVMSWMNRYGFWASGIFRFTPGLRFPGHLACGMTKVPLSKFILIDGGAALLSVPTQILLIGFYGRDVVQYFKEFKYGLFIFLALLVVFFLAKKWFFRSLPHKQTSQS